MKRLILAPHGDDEVLGCGGTLAKYPHECHVHVVSDKSDGRMDEFKAAQSVLGYLSFSAMGIPTGQIAANMRALVTDLDKIIDTFCPEYLYIPRPGLHQDHIAVYEAGLRSARLGFGKPRHFVPKVMVYDISAYGDTDLFQTGLIWNHVESLTVQQINKKVQAFQAYESQQVGNVNGHMLKDEAFVIGHQVGVAYGERYSAIRQVIA